jgi:hypothetical protein
MVIFCHAFNFLKSFSDSFMNVFFIFCVDELYFLKIKNLYFQIIFLICVALYNICFPINLVCLSISIIVWLNKKNILINKI